MQTFQISIPEVAEYLSITVILKVSHISTSHEPKKIFYLPSAQIIKDVFEFVIQEIGGAEGDRWRCRRLFYVVPLKTKKKNMCCRMNRCISHACVTQFMCFPGFYQSVMPQKRQCEQLDISLVSSEIQN